MQTIGVVGASGTLGRVVVQNLLAQADTAVCALVRTPDPQLQGLSGCQVMTGGIFDAPTLKEFVAASDIVINLAAKNPAGQEQDLEELEQFFDANVLGAWNVARECDSQDVPLLHFSTVSVYETGAYRAGEYLKEHEELPWPESRWQTYFEALYGTLRDAVNSGSKVPASEVLQRYPYPSDLPVYGFTKLLGEKLVLSSASDILAVRMCDVYGPGHESRGVITDHLNNLKDHDVTVNFDFRAVVCFVFIQDVVSFIQHFLKAKDAQKTLPRRINLTGPAVTESEFLNVLESICEKDGIKEPTLRVGHYVGDRFDRRYGDDRLQKLFPELSLTPLDEGVYLTWKSMK